MPSIAVVTYVLPVTVVIEVLDTGNILAHIVIAEIAIVRIVIVRIGEISVVIYIASIVSLGIAIAIITIDQSACLSSIDTREHCVLAILTTERQ